MTALLQAENLSKAYPRGEDTVQVLDGCAFTLAAGEAVAVMGASGSGKSTLLNILGGLDRPDDGHVLFDGEPLRYQNHGWMADWRSRGVGFVFQFHFLLPDFTALENLLIPVRSLGPVTDQHRRRAAELLEMTGLAQRAEHRPGELSGGEQQRVAVARAFMNRPRIVLADEPFGNLDQGIGAQLTELLFALRERDGTSLVIVTHDPALARRADRLQTLERGRLTAGEVSA